MSWVKRTESLVNAKKIVSQHSSIFVRDRVWPTRRERERERERERDRERERQRDRERETERERERETGTGVGAQPRLLAASISVLTGNSKVMIIHVGSLRIQFFRM